MFFHFLPPLALLGTGIPAWVLALGLVGQGIFTARFLVQWYASEKKRDSVVPVSFWWISLVGGGMMFLYGVLRKDPVLILGQSLGVFAYTRNLMLVEKRKAREVKAAARAAKASTEGTGVRVDAPQHAATPSAHASAVHVNGTGHHAPSRQG
jgi:lipid-A-disaccharide synthase-like uncharacterized protein